MASGAGAQCGSETAPPGHRDLGGWLALISVAGLDRERGREPEQGLSAARRRPGHATCAGFEPDGADSQGRPRPLLAPVRFAGPARPRLVANRADVRPGSGSARTNRTAATDRNPAPRRFRRRGSASDRVSYGSGAPVRVGARDQSARPGRTAMRRPDFGGTAPRAWRLRCRSGWPAGPLGTLVWGGSSIAAGSRHQSERSESTLRLAGSDAAGRIAGSGAGAVTRVPDRGLVPGSWRQTPWRRVVWYQG